MTIAILRALHAVIGSAIDEIEQVYKTQSSSTGLHLDYPSLDVPFYSTRTNSPEVEKSEELRTDPIVFGAANKIVAACGQFTATVHKPFFSLIECVNGVRLPFASVHVTLTIKVGSPVGQFDRVHAVHGGDAHRGDLARSGFRWGKRQRYRKQGH